MLIQKGNTEHTSHPHFPPYSKLGTKYLLTPITSLQIWKWCNGVLEGAEMVLNTGKN